MQFVLFSKHWPGISIEEMIEKTHYIGADGMDLAVRPGFAVNPDNVADELVPAVRKIRAAGLDVPMITTDASFLDPHDPGSKATAEAMREAGVSIAKLGYWRWKPGETPYWDCVAKIRNALNAATGQHYTLNDLFNYRTQPLHR